MNYTFGSIPYSVSIAVVLPNIAGNILCCLVIAKTKSLHSFCNFLLVNLAVSDIMAGLIEILAKTYKQLDKYINNFEEMALRKFVLFVHPMIQVSILTVTVISVERFLAITQPFKVMRKGRTKNLKFIIPCVWILGFVLNIPGFVAFLGQKEPKDFHELPGSNELAVEGIIFLVSAYIAPSILLVYTFFRMLFVLRRRHQAFKSQQSQGACLQANRRAAKLLGAVIFTHNICFLPYTIVVFLMTQSFGFDTVKSSNIMAYNITYTLQFLSPCLNPFIYFAHSRAFRDACKTLFCRSKKIKP